MPDETGTSGKEQVSGPSPSRRGEEIAREHEPGQHEDAQTGADRPAGKADARRSTGINAEAEDPISEDSPNLPPA